MKFRTWSLSFALLASLVMANEAQASIQRSADFAQGNTIGLGLFGLSYDYGLGPISLGLMATTPLPTIPGLSNNSYQPYLKLSTRAVWRMFESDNLSAGLLVGLEYDPGNPGSRSWLTPDVGFAVAYGFKIFEVPIALRLNVTVAASRNTQYYSDLDTTSLPSRNFLQQLTVGPNTSLELAFKPNENLELTLGGGTVVGMRLHF